MSTFSQIRAHCNYINTNHIQIHANDIHDIKFDIQERVKLQDTRLIFSWRTILIQ